MCVLESLFLLQLESETLADFLQIIQKLLSGFQSFYLSETQVIIIICFCHKYVVVEFKSRTYQVHKE